MPTSDQNQNRGNQNQPKSSPGQTQQGQRPVQDPNQQQSRTYEREKGPSRSESDMNPSDRHAKDNR